MRISQNNTDAMQNRNAGATRNKGFTRLENEARRQLEEILANCSASFTLLPQGLQQEMVQKLRPLAQKTILNALEGRTEEEDVQFGLDWEKVLPRIYAKPPRVEAARNMLKQLPDIDQALRDPEVQKRNAIEWLYDESAGRILKFTPYLVREEQELAKWKEQCPDAWDLAHREADRQAEAFQDRSKPIAGAMPRVSNDARDLSYLAHMIACRKFYLAATRTSEFFDGNRHAVSLKVPEEQLQQYFSAKKISVRFGTNPQPVNYQPADKEQMHAYTQMLRSVMLRNLQAEVCPWTSANGLIQKVDSNLFAKAYYQIVRPATLQPGISQLDEATFQKLGGDISKYRMLGFRENISTEQAKIFEDVLSGNPGLQEFLDKPSVQEALRIRRTNNSLVQLCLDAAVAHELVRSVQGWNPQAVSTQSEKIVSRAQSTLPHVMQDLAQYHQKLQETDYLAARGGNSYKEHLSRLHLAELPPKDRAKIESYYNPMAVALIAKPEGFSGAMPADWKALRSYKDPVTGMDFTDYAFETPKGKAIMCMAAGVAPQTGRRVADSLLDLEQPPQIRDAGTKVKGVRISELSFNELTSSCLMPRSIARMQFYTSYNPAFTLGKMIASTESPSNDNLIEALRPCLILDYGDDKQKYCRVKPAERAGDGPKYRTPTTEKLRELGLAKGFEIINPCWDASQILGGLSANRMAECHDDVEVPLIVIEGEKKAAMLAQMMQETKLPFHVISLPGVWMGLIGPKNNKRLVDELAVFRMRDDSGKRRKVLIFFDNDKAYNPQVTDAMATTAKCFQKAGADVFITNLPFGKRIKGADDFAAVHCRKADGAIDYGPLAEILNKSVQVPERLPDWKYPKEAEQRDIGRYLDEAEHINEYQEALRKSPEPLIAPEFRKLFMLQAPYVYQIVREREALALFDAQQGPGKQKLLDAVMRDNIALKNLKRACMGIPNFENGTTLQERLSNAPSAPAETTNSKAVQEMFAMG